VASPFQGIFNYEKSINIPRGSLLGVIKKYGDSSAFAKLETSSITFEQFCVSFEEQCRQSGFQKVSGRDFVNSLEACWDKANKEIITAILLLRKHGILTAALTNNWYGPVDAQLILPTTLPTSPTSKLSSIPTLSVTPALSATNTHTHLSEHPPRSNFYGLQGLFDVVVESRVVKLRKPDPRIYEVVCERLGVLPSQCVYLDDIGSNLKPAKQMGMHTIHVRPEKNGVANAIRGLQKFFDFSLYGFTEPKL